MAATEENLWIESQFPRDFRGHAVECGAWDGQEGSHTLALEHAGWTVLCVEPNPDCETPLKIWRDKYVMCAASDHDAEKELLHIHARAGAASGFTSLHPVIDNPKCRPEDGALWQMVNVRVRTLRRLLVEAEFPKLDVAVIDTEGTELDVLKGLDLVVFRPKVLVVESWDEDSETARYVIAHGYRHVGRLTVNDLFVDAR